VGVWQVAAAAVQTHEVDLHLTGLLRGVRKQVAPRDGITDSCKIRWFAFLGWDAELG
jgi:hypothetical protein